MKTDRKPATDTFDVNTATLQEACDYAVRMIVKQGEQCLSGGYCSYGERGKHCAVGWLIPNNCEEYAAVMRFEGGIDELADDFGDALPASIVDNTEVLGYLQSFHDRLEKNLRELHRDYLYELGINVSAPHWQQWIDMGEEV